MIVSRMTGFIAVDNAVQVGKVSVEINALCIFTTNSPASTPILPSQSQLHIIACTSITDYNQLYLANNKCISRRAPDYLTSMCNVVSDRFEIGHFCKFWSSVTLTLTLVQVIWHNVV